MKALLTITKRIAATAVVVSAVAAALALAPTAGAFTYGTYDVQDPDITCATTFDPNTGAAISKSIQINSFVMTTPRSYQKVSYQAILFRWNGSAWTQDTTMQEIVGDTNNVLPTPLQFNVPVTSDAYYRVAVKYRWYWNGAVEQTQYKWAGTHTMHFAIFSATGYSMWNGDSGDWCHMNVDRAS